jgi:protein SCO1/2
MLVLWPVELSAAHTPTDGVAFEPPAHAMLPRDAAFADETGRHVRLADYFGARPLLIVPAYYGCSNLCSTVLSGLRASLAAAQIRAGRDVDVLVTSISPLDGVAEAAAKKQSIVGGVRDASGWHFLTGNEAAIDQVATALGYRYRYDTEDRQYAHATGIAVAAPDGSIASVLYGVAFSPQALRGALSAKVADQPAVEGDVRNWLPCFHYDPRTGRYSFVAMNAVRAAGLLALFALVAYVARAQFRQRRAVRPGVRR